MELRRLYANYAYLIYCYKIIFGMVDLTTSDFFQWPLAQVSEDIPLNYIRTTAAVLHVSDAHFSVSALLMYGMVYQQTLILAHVEVLPAQLNLRIYLYL